MLFKVRYYKLRRSKPIVNIAFTHIIILTYSPAGAFQNGTSLRGNAPSIRPRNRVQITLPAFIV